MRAILLYFKTQSVPNTKGLAIVTGLYDVPSTNVHLMTHKEVGDAIPVTVSVDTVITVAVEL